MAPLVWPDDQHSAVSLAFFEVDSADLAAILERLGPRMATFFTSPTEVLRAVSAWQEVAEAGHEIGNGCLIGATDDGDLPNWTRRSIEQELFMAQTFFDDIFESFDMPTFAYPGVCHSCADGSYVPTVQESYAYAVMPLDGANDVSANLQAILSTEANVWSGGDGSGTWSVIRISNPEELATLELDGCWVAPVGTVAKFIADNR